MYAIRQKSTGWWMPSFPGHAGGTYLEPKEGALPRLFRRKQDAKIALDWWLGGKVVKSYDMEGDFLDFTQKPVEGRNADDMEIVEVEVIVR